MSSPTTSWRSTSPVPFRALSYKQQKLALLSLAKQGVEANRIHTRLEEQAWKIRSTQKWSGGWAEVCAWVLLWLLPLIRLLSLQDMGAGQPASWLWVAMVASLQNGPGDLHPCLTPLVVLSALGRASLCIKWDLVCVSSKDRLYKMLWFLPFSLLDHLFWVKPAAMP